MLLSKGGRRNHGVCHHCSTTSILQIEGMGKVKEKLGGYATHLRQERFFVMGYE